MVKIVAVRRSDVMMSVERSFFLLCVLGFILSDGVSGMVFPPFSFLRKVLENQALYAMLQLKTLFNSSILHSINSPFWISSLLFLTAFIVSLSAIVSRVAIICSIL